MTGVTALWQDFHREMTGHRPFRWQDRMLAEVAATGTWPQALSAPTGAGKSTVLLMHVFLNGAAGAGLLEESVRDKLPRRWWAVVNRRALVDAQYSQALAYRQALEQAAPGSVTAVIADGLVARQGALPAPGPLLVNALRGGAPRSRQWREHLTAVQIICATPDMWGSRALFRGYGASAQARPQEAALAVLDSVLMLDEAHLNQQLLTTARRIADMDDPAGTGVPGLHVLAVTATPVDADDDSTVVTVDPVSERSDKAMLRRLRAPKALTVVDTAVPVTVTTTTKRGKTRSATKKLSMAEHVLAHTRRLVAARARRGIDAPVLVVLNTVAAAIELRETLDRESICAIALLGPLRAADTAAMLARHDGLFTSDPDRRANPHGVEAVVATQTIEVGVDLDAWAMVTELAPGSALAQRAGRVNRAGSRTDSEIVVVLDPLGTSVYSPVDMVRAASWITDPERTGLDPAALAADPPPVATAGRLALERLLPAEVSTLAMTSPGALFTEPDLDVWLREDMTGDQATASIVVRPELTAPAGHHDPGAPWLQSVAQMLAAERHPDPAELLTAKLFVVRARLAALPAHWPGLVLPGRYPAEEARPTDIAVLDGDPERRASQVRPGDIVVIALGAPLTCAGVLRHDEATEITAPVPMGEVPGSARAVWRIGPDRAAAVRTAVAELRITDEAIAAVPELAQLARRPSEQLRVLTPDSPDENSAAPDWVVVIADELDDGLISTIGSTSRCPVLLDDHGGAVARAAAELATELGLAPHLVEALTAAGLYHDAGKADPRFQTYRLGNPGTDGPESAAPVLAKSTRSSAVVRRLALSTSGLPPRWRHELLSAAYLHADLPHGGADPSQQALMARLDDAQRALAVRLVGTSHGHGRGLLPPGSSAEHLCTDDTDPALRAAVDDLFGRHRWHDITDAAAARFTPWRMALLEAILRIADHHVSAKGQ